MSSPSKINNYFNINPKFVIPIGPISLILCTSSRFDSPLITPQWTCQSEIWAIYGTSILASNRGWSGVTKKERKKEKNGATFAHMICTRDGMRFEVRVSSDLLRDELCVASYGVSILSMGNAKQTDWEFDCLRAGISCCGCFPGFMRHIFMVPLASTQWVVLPVAQPNIKPGPSYLRPPEGLGGLVFFGKGNLGHLRTSRWWEDRWMRDI